MRTASSDGREIETLSNVQRIRAYPVAVAAHCIVNHWTPSSEPALRNSGAVSTAGHATGCSLVVARRARGWAAAGDATTKASNAPHTALRIPQQYTARVEIHEAPRAPSAGTNSPLPGCAHPLGQRRHEFDGSSNECDGYAIKCLASSPSGPQGLRMQSSEHSGRGLRERKRGPAVAHLTAYVDPDLARRVKLRALAEGRTGSEIVGEALEQLLGPAANGQRAEVR